MAIPSLVSPHMHVQTQRRLFTLLQNAQHAVTPFRRDTLAQHEGGAWRQAPTCSNTQAGINTDLTYPNIWHMETHHTLPLSHVQIHTRISKYKDNNLQCMFSSTCPSLGVVTQRENRQVHVQYVSVSSEYREEGEGVLKFSVIWNQGNKQIHKSLREMMGYSPWHRESERERL